MSNRQRNTVPLLGVTLVYALLTILMTWPVAAQLGTHLVGNGDDLWVHFWNGWWVKQVLQQGGTPYRTNLLFHPVGVSLLYHNFGWANIALWLGLEPLVGGVAAYNLTCLIHIPLCGLAMFFLTRHLTGSHVAAFVAGLIYAFWPYRMLDLHHPNMISTEGFPLLVLLLMRIFRGKNQLRDAILTGVLVGLIGYMRWQLLILAAFLAGVYFLYVAVWERQHMTWQAVGFLGLSVVLASVLMTPGLLPVFSDLASTKAVEDVTVVDVTDGRQEFLAWVMPQDQHPLSHLYSQLFPRYGFSSTRERYSAFLGHLVLLLTVVGAVTRGTGKQRWFWIGLAILSATLALGYYLRFNDVLYRGIPLPYKLLGGFLPFRLLRHPHRFNALLALPVGVLAGVGAHQIREWLTQKRWARGLARPTAFASVLGLLVLADYVSAPTATVSADIPDYYKSLGREPGAFAVVALPNDRDRTERHMYYQTAHRRPLLGGHVSRLPPDALDFISSVDIIGDIYREAGIRTDLPDVSRQLSPLSEAGFRYIVIDKDLADDEELEAWRSYLAVPPLYEDRDVLAYRTDPLIGPDVPVQHDLGRGMALLRVDLSSRELRPESVLDVNVVWATTASQGEDLDVLVSLVSPEGEPGQTQRFGISPGWPTGSWPANAIVHDQYNLEIDPWASAGEKRVELTLARSSDGLTVGRGASVDRVILQRPPQTFTEPAVEHPLSARFGRGLQLLGYDLDVGDGALTVTLHWQAVQRMEASYKVFVHLDSAGGGPPVAQADVVPRNWTYPTDWWEAREYVSDEVAVPLEGVPPGAYSLWVGVYEPDSGRRLPILEVDAEQESESRLHLTQLALD